MVAQCDLKKEKIMSKSEAPQSLEALLQSSLYMLSV